MPDPRRTPDIFGAPADDPYADLEAADPRFNWRLAIPFAIGWLAACGLLYYLMTKLVAGQLDERVTIGNMYMGNDYLVVNPSQDFVRHAPVATIWTVLILMVVMCVLCAIAYFVLPDRYTALGSYLSLALAVAIMAGALKFLSDYAIGLSSADADKIMDIYEFGVAAALFSWMFLSFRALDA